MPVPEGVEPVPESVRRRCWKGLERCGCGSRSGAGGGAGAVPVRDPARCGAGSGLGAALAPPRRSPGMRIPFGPAAPAGGPGRDGREPAPLGGSAGWRAAQAGRCQPQHSGRGSSLLELFLLVLEALGRYRETGDTLGTRRGPWAACGPWKCQPLSLQRGYVFSSGFTIYSSYLLSYI